MRTYKLVVVVKPSVNEADRKKLVGTVKDWLKGLKVVKEDDLGSKALAYKIKGDLTGHYFDFQLEGETFPGDFEKKMLEQETILRHLVVRTK